MTGMQNKTEEKHESGLGLVLGSAAVLSITWVSYGLHGDDVPMIPLYSTACAGMWLLLNAFLFVQVPFLRIACSNVRRPLRFALLAGFFANMVYSVALSFMPAGCLY